MHESRVVADLVARVESELDPALERVTRLELCIGALSPIPSVALRVGLEDHVARAWGYVPEVVVDRSEDIADPGATGVALASIRVGD